MEWANGGLVQWGSVVRREYECDYSMSESWIIIDEYVHEVQKWVHVGLVQQHSVFIQWLRGLTVGAVKQGGGRVHQGGMFTVVGVSAYMYVDALRGATQRLETGHVWGFCLQFLVYAVHRGGGSGGVERGPVGKSWVNWHPPRGLLLEENVAVLRREKQNRLVWDLEALVYQRENLPGKVLFMFTPSSDPRSKNTSTTI